MSCVHTLANGLRVVADPMPSLESASIGVWVRAGSADEGEGEHGLAHLLEHMAFKGTKTRSARDIAEEIEAVGGYLNAATSHQRTGYYVRILKEDIALGLDLLSDILANPAFDENEFRKEKDVVIQEIGEAADIPDDVVFENLQAVCWDGHPIARPILGSREAVRAHTTNAMRAFMARGYRPAEMVVAGAGRIAPEDFFARVEALFGGWSGAGAGNVRRAPVFRGGLRHDGRAIEQTHFAVAFPGVSTRDEDFYAARVLAEALGGGMSSRLFQRVRETEGLAYSVYAFSDSYDDCGLVGAYAGADAEEIPAVAAAFREELAAMADAVTEAEIARTRAMLRAAMLMSLESPTARIEAAAGQIFRDGAIMTPAEVTARVEAVTAADVRRCARRALDGPVAVSIVGPADAEAAQRALAA